MLTKLILISALLLASCAAEETTKTVWNDFTGNKRGDAALKMNEGACQLVYQQSYTQAQNIYTTPNANCTNAQCGALQAATIITNNNNMQNYANNAYYNCMRGFGWELKTVQVVPASQKTDNNTNTNVKSNVRRWCEVDTDCGSRMSCRVVAGGGTECRAR